MVSSRRKVDRDQTYPPYHAMLGPFTRGHTLATRRLRLRQSPTALAIPNIRMFSHCIPPASLNRYLASRFFGSNLDLAAPGKVVKGIGRKFWPNENHNSKKMVARYVPAACGSRDAHRSTATMRPAQHTRTRPGPYITGIAGKSCRVAHHLQALISTVPILAPLPNITMHVAKTPSIR